MPVVKDAWPYVITGLIISIALYLLSGFPVAAPFMLVTAFVLWFFRDPRRTPPEERGLILAPADGRIIKIESLDKDPEIGRGNLVSIFMSIFNVHVNRSPLTGKVAAIRYHQGRFLSAFKDKASYSNERNEILFKDKDRLVRCVQIAGLIARRIVCSLNEDQTVAAGDKLGLIKFGSRVDVFIPEAYSVIISKGDKTKGGETILARLKEKENERPA